MSTSASLSSLALLACVFLGAPALAQPAKTLEEREATLRAQLEASPDPAELHEFTGYGGLPAAARARLLPLIDAGLEANPQWVKQEVHSGIQRLHLAVFRGQPEVVALLLKHGAGASDRALAHKDHWVLPIHVATGVERLPLYESGRPNDLGVLKALLKAGAKADAPDSAGRLPITGAARWGSAEALELLLAKGAKLETTDKEGRTLLHLAALSGNVPAAKLLLSKGLDPNALDAKHRTPLSRAQSVAVAAALLDAKANLNDRDQGDMSALDHAIWRKDAAVVALLRERGARLAPHTAAALGVLEPLSERATIAALESRVNDATLLQWAIHGDQALAARRLLARGADPNNASGQGHPLALAFRQRSAPLIKVLLAAGADPNHQSEPKTDAPVHHAVRTRSLELLQLLGPHEPNMGLVGRYERTPLHVIARECFAAGFVDFALKHGAKVDAKGPNDETPLYAALFSRSGNAKVVAELLAAGADPHARSRNGKTCLEIARWGKRVDVLDMLEKAAKAAKPRQP